MKKVGILIFGAALVTGLVVANIFSFGRVGNLVKFSMDFGRVHGSGNVVKETREVARFTGIDVGSVFEVTVVAQSEQGVEIEADDNLMPLIQTEVRGGRLHIESDKRFKSGSPVRIRISVQNIDEIEVSGAANVSISDLKNDAIKIESSGGSKVTVTGETMNLKVETSGGAKVFTSELASINADIDGSGGSFVEVNVSGELRTHISGGSHVKFVGTPTNVIVKKSGGARVSKK